MTIILRPDHIASKLCLICKQAKPLDQFHKMKRAKGGVHPHCKKCRSQEWQRNSSANLKRLAQYRESINGRAIHLLKEAKRRAAKSELEFSITPLRITFALSLGVCERSGVKFDLSPHDRQTNNPFSPSIDKVDPFKGYTDENIKVVCVAYNFGKMQMTHEEYVAFCKCVVEFNK
jgi:hypothetical protein